MLGSLLCAMAWSMAALIAFRGVQGLGAGAIQPAGVTIMGDIYSVAERAVVQGYVAGVWAVSAVVGPTLGGLLSEHASWRWIFWINIPLGALAAFALMRRFHEQPHRDAVRKPLDVGGALLLAGAAGLVLIGLLEGGIRWDWWSPVGVGTFAGAAVLLVVFVFVERRVADPVLPLWVFRHRVLTSSMVGAFVVGMVMLGMTSYVPVYAQQILNASPVVAGLAVAATAIGWPIASATAGVFYMRWGFRPCLLAGAVFGVVGTLIVLSAGPGSSVLVVAGGCFVLGFGLGYVASPAVIAAQSAVVWRDRGVATGTNMFARSVGSAVGVAIFGAVANSIVASRLGGSTDVDLEKLPLDVLEPALHAVFVGVAITAVALVVAGALMPRHFDEATDEARPSTAA